MPLSGSEHIEARFSATSAEADPGFALRDALFAIQRQMGSGGFAPPHLVSMLWEVADPNAVDLAQMQINLAYRDVFTGFRPPIDIRPYAAPGLKITALCRRAAQPPSPEITALEQAYSARRGVDMQAVLRRWSAEGRAAREALRATGQAKLDIAFGPGAFERLDLFLPAGTGPHPCRIFLHGGYWMATDKAQYAQFVEGMLAAGYAVALPNYALAPEAGFERQVGDCLRALQVLAARAGEFRLDASQMHLSGHSAGAHLAAMVAVEPAVPPLKSLLLLSGLFDLAPLGATPLGALLGLDDGAHAARFNPLARPRPPGLAIAHALGSLEAPGFFEQAHRLESRWNVTPSLVVADSNHFSLLEGLKSGALLDFALGNAR
jgi:arylformamidase